jgi:hypothetical protein
MKTTILFFAMLFSINSYAQPTNPMTSAEMTFVSETYDYGTIKQGANGDCEFEFTNTGSTALIITNAIGSCGCTVPDWPKKPILPGQKGVIKVHYNTSKTGIINKYVTLTANIEGKEMKIYIKGMVEAVNTSTTPIKTEEGIVPKN